MRDWDLIQFCIFLRFNSKRGIRQPNLSQLSDNFPALKVLARKYLSITATSASVERPFSEMLRQQQADPSS